MIFFSWCLSILLGIILVYDLTNQKSLENLEKWVRELMRFDIGSFKEWDDTSQCKMSTG